MRKRTPEEERRWEWHGWAFMAFTAEQKAAIKHYIKTGEKLPALPAR